jgi:hypothetical protein
MSTLFSKATLLCVALALLLALASAPARAQITVNNEHVTFKFGIQGQLWGDWTQASTGSQGLPAELVTPPAAPHYGRRYRQGHQLFRRNR